MKTNTSPLSITKIKISILCMTLLTKTFAFNCDKMRSRFEKCGASFKFDYEYGLLCTQAGELHDADITSIHKFLDQEMMDNPCLQKVYREPQFNRRERHEFSKEQEKFFREQDKLNRKEKLEMYKMREQRRKDKN